MCVCGGGGEGLLITYHLKYASIKNFSRNHFLFVFVLGFFFFFFLNFSSNFKMINQNNKNH